ncbi:MAG: FAD:protein FMN transferase [Bacteroidales bacterium]|nr:FAD:protein FMN transferase [Bacteroidales bacterium]
MQTETEYIREQRLFHGMVPRVMGTKLELMTVGTEEDVARNTWDEICTDAEKLDSMLNRFSPESEVSKINAMHGCDRLTLSSALLDILRLSIDCWYLQARTEAKLRRSGAECAFVDFGNSAILAIGHHPFGDSWRVSLPNPYNGAILDEFQIRDRALSTSGNTPGYTGHIVHPLTGKANVERKIVSVTDRSALDAEVLSTALMIADEGQRLRIGRSFPAAQIKTYHL